MIQALAARRYLLHVRLNRLAGQQIHWLNSHQTPATRHQTPAIRQPLPIPRPSLATRLSRLATETHCALARSALQCPDAGDVAPSGAFARGTLGRSARAGLERDFRDRAGAGVLERGSPGIAPACRRTGRAERRVHAAGRGSRGVQRGDHPRGSRSDPARARSARAAADGRARGIFDPRRNPRFAANLSGGADRHRPRPPRGSSAIPAHSPRIAPALRTLTRASFGSG